MSMIYIILILRSSESALHSGAPAKLPEKCQVACPPSNSFHVLCCWAWQCHDGKDWSMGEVVAGLAENDCEILRDRYLLGMGFMMFYVILAETQNWIHGDPWGMVHDSAQHNMSAPPSKLILHKRTAVWNAWVDLRVVRRSVKHQHSWANMGMSSQSPYP